MASRWKTTATESFEDLALDGYRRMALDGVGFPVSDRDRVPVGVVRVPVTLYQPGLDPQKTALLAGSMGMQVIEKTVELRLKQFQVGGFCARRGRLPGASSGWT